MNNAYVQVNNFLNKIEKDIKAAEKQRRRKAATIVARQMRKNLSTRYSGSSPEGEFPGQVTGDLKKSIGMFNGKTASIVGTKNPLGNHAHLLEFGHRDINGKIVPARPFLGPTFREMAPTIKAILSDRWID